jgi:hypothetical protein
MADINIQFHALPEEVAEWLLDWIEREQVNLVAINYSPFSARLVDPPRIAAVVTNDQFDRLSMLIQTRDLGGNNRRQFDELHPNQLVLEVGRLAPDGLAQSWLAARSDDEAALKVWKRIASDLVGHTRQGVTCINRQNGAASFEKSFRFTRGAERLQSEGVRILPPQGPNGPMIRLGPTLNL